MDNELSWDLDKETISDFLKRTSESKKKFTLQTPENSISDEGIDALDYYLRKCLGIGSLPEGWNYSWLCTKKHMCLGYVGTLPKRISNYYWKSQGVRLSADQVSEIGNIAKRHTEDRSEYHVDFTNKFDWKAGAFGDDGSCFWASRHNARELLVQNDCYAVRFWERYDSQHSAFMSLVNKYIPLLSGTIEEREAVARGIAKKRMPDLSEDNDSAWSGLARAWIAPIEEQAAVVFNSYPKNWQLVRTARIVADFLGVSYRRVDYNNRDEILYINNGTGFLLAPSEKCFSKSSVYTDFYWTAGYCELCDTPLRNHNWYFVRSNMDEMKVCEHCYNRHGISCERCGSHHLREDGVVEFYTSYRIATTSNLTVPEQYSERAQTTRRLSSSSYTTVVEKRDSIRLHNVYKTDYAMCNSCAKELMYECKLCGHVQNSDDFQSIPWINHNDAYYFYDDYRHAQAWRKRICIKCYFEQLEDKVRKLNRKLEVLHD